MHEVAVLIPVYKELNALSAYERLSFDQCISILKAYTIILVKPGSLNVQEYLHEEPKLKIQEFDDHYFKSIKGYNALLLHPSFYQRFLDHTFILIYQLDAFVFFDALLSWTKAGYDYIGAPWLAHSHSLNKEEKKDFDKKVRTAYILNQKKENSHLPSDWQFFNKVGNGGFSLRRTRLFFSIAIEMKEMTEYYLANGEHAAFNEDVFWSLEVNRTKRRLKIPGFKKAALFSLESQVLLGFQYNKLSYPFGCHGWNKNIEIWKPLFAHAGHLL